MNDIKHQHLFKVSRDKPAPSVELKVEARVLAVALRGGGWHSAGVIQHQLGGEDTPKNKGRRKKEVENGERAGFLCWLAVWRCWPFN